MRSVCFSIASVTPRIAFHRTLVFISHRFAAWREATSPLASPSAAAFTPSVFLTTAAKRELSSDPLTDSGKKAARLASH